MSTTDKVTVTHSCGCRQTLLGYTPEEVALKEKGLCHWHENREVATQCGHEYNKHGIHGPHPLAQCRTCWAKASFSFVPAGPEDKHTVTHTCGCCMSLIGYTKEQAEAKAKEPCHYHQRKTTC